ncbi:39S ribosomal protein L52, mitochondrial [Frankliniella fusca]|uniref:Large ribosomal subunit protein mL52 n=1 Tax=Frankliniella fusca TaxID=407009 RepID=A0AAE1LLJ6_9NEOP|nr:39S ribosomal protein L52, mitochondrial [Frankliniella fusca]
MSKLFLKVSLTPGSSLSFVRKWSTKPKPWIYRKPVEYITPHDIFRKRLGLAPKLNQTKELQEYSDYTFHDGRPAPVRPGQLREIKRQQSLAEAAVMHLKEIKFIVDRDNERKQRAANERRHIIESKLKPKGDQLLKTEG